MSIWYVLGMLLVTRHIQGLIFSNILSQDVCGSQEKHFVVRRHNKPTIRYTLQVGDECIVAPLSLFNTELLNVTGNSKKAKVQKPARQQPDPEDCFDAEYLRETGVRVLLQININCYSIGTLL